ncbi:MAG TPA: hypothetical protein VGJ26_06450, partial [Pirellulales bacterium]
MSSTYDVSQPKQPTSPVVKAPAKDAGKEAVKTSPAAPGVVQTGGAVPVAKGLPPRLLSLDAYRGFIMLVMASEGFGFPQVANKFKESEFWGPLGYHFSHVKWLGGEYWDLIQPNLKVRVLGLQWLGCAFWDLIQPSFMFMVGVAMAYSYAARAAKGQSYLRMLGHAVWRSIVLVLLGVFLRSGDTTNWTFMDVVSQIGLGYTFLFLLWNRPRWVQGVAAAVILIGYWVAFAAYPLPGPDFDYARVGVTEDWAEKNHVDGFKQHWAKNTNAAAAFDRWFLNQFPRKNEFLREGSGYPTLNFIPSLATMIFGLMTGEMLRGSRGKWQKLGIMAGAGVIALGVGKLIDVAGICPIVKVIWTPSWAIFSAGWVLLILSAFYAVIDCVGLRAWSFPLRVVGMNSIAIYVMSKMLDGWIHGRLMTHFGKDVYKNIASHLVEDYQPYVPIVERVAVLFVMWLVCLWMYRQKIF